MLVLLQLSKMSFSLKKIYKAIFIISLSLYFLPFFSPFLPSLINFPRFPIYRNNNNDNNNNNNNIIIYNQ